jgi:hypothetical protein
LPLRRKTSGKELPVPGASDNLPAIAREFVGEVLRIADAEDLQAGFEPETSGRKSDRSQVRLQVARRHVDDQPPDTAVAHRRQFRGDELVMPARREEGARVELAETVLCEAGKIGAK